MTTVEFAGAELVLDGSGALYYAIERLLVVADLHIEKGRSIGSRHRRPLPPYDTRETLRRLGDAVARYNPQTIVCLGDSFHDAEAVLSLEVADRSEIAVLAAGRRWVWISGNHDPIIPASMGGEVVQELAVGSLLFRHDYRQGNLVVIGHFHPVAVVAIGGRLLRRRCFVVGERVLIMPAFGSYAGGLNVLHPVIASLSDEPPKIFVLGTRGAHQVDRGRLILDNLHPSVRGRR